MKAHLFLLRKNAASVREGVANRSNCNRLLTKKSKCKKRIKITLTNLDRICAHFKRQWQQTSCQRPCSSSYQDIENRSQGVRGRTLQHSQEMRVCKRTIDLKSPSECQANHTHQDRQIMLVFLIPLKLLT